MEIEKGLFDAMYIDIHSHILYGLDDGSKNVEQSFKMLKIAHENEIQDIIVTPHNKANRHNASKRTIEERMAELQHHADENGYGMHLYAGTEFYYRSELVELLNQKKVCTMADSAYVLIEFSPRDDYAYIRDGLYAILSAGYRPIIAHIERYQAIMKDQSLVDDLIDMGCYVQVNVGSVMGRFGFRTKSDTRKLLQNGRVHFLATDAHNDTERPPEIDSCVRKLYRKYDEKYIDDLIYKNARKVIENVYI
ncbi:MAG: protein-tyrosine-phosphatase [Lachnospiraceae bacterium]|nr:protein-tyrosine-phosphatase [Lachnospiraceae bacterium]